MTTFGNAVLCAALFAWGFLYRDGFPPLSSTHLARAAGGFISCAGASAVCSPSYAAIIGIAVWASFYTDTKHGEGQRAQGWKDAFWLSVSGVTSAAPLAIALLNPFVLLLGFAKPPIWFGCWEFVPERKYINPTRVAAALFGLLNGMAVVLSV